MSLKERILRFYQGRPGKWISSAEIEKLTMEHTSYIASNASRQCRVLFEEGKLEREHRPSKDGRKKIAWYRYPITSPREQILKDNRERVAQFDQEYQAEQLAKRGLSNGQGFVREVPAPEKEEQSD